jgi:tetratricopeptide (TPR) repeat protein
MFMSKAEPTARTDTRPPGALAVVILALFLLLTACSEPNPNEEAALHLKRSQAYQQQGQFRAALIEARNAMRLAPEDMGAYLQMIGLYNQLGYYRSTLDIIDSIPVPGHPMVILEKAKAFNALKKHRSAQQLLLGTSVKFDASETSFYQLYLGQALAGQGKLEDGRLSLQKASAGAARQQALIEIARIDALTDDSQAAMAVLQQLLDKNPRDVDALILAGEIASYEGDFDQAKDYLSNALSYLPSTDIMLPQRINTIQMLSRVLTMQDRSAEALLYNRILAKELPEYIANRNKIEQSLTLIEQGELQQAEDILLAVVEQGGDNYAGTLLGIVNYMQGDLSEASEMLSTHLDPETANSQALELLVSAKFQLDEIDQILSILGPEVQARTDNASLLGLYGLAKLAKQDLDGIKHISRSLELEPANSRLRLALVSFYQQQGQAQQALEQARLAYTYDASSQMVQGALVQQLIANEKALEARQMASEIANSNPDDSRSLTLAGLTFLRIQQPDKAEKYLQQAVEVDSENATAWLALARIAFLEQQFKVAETYYSYVVDILPNTTEAYKGIVSTHEARQDVAPALAALTQYADNDSSNGIPQAVLAEFYLRSKDLEQARPAIEQALQRQANNAYIERVGIAIYQQSARQALWQEDIKSARRYLSLGLSHVPNAVPLLELLARVEAADHNPAAAMETVDSLQQLAPAIAYEVKGDILSASNREAALEAYSSAWELGASASLARKMHALLALDPIKATAFADEWSRQLPGDPGLLLVSALEAQQNNDNKTAIRTYEALLEQEPGNITALNNLAWLYFTEADPRAMQLGLRAVELSPHNPAILDTYGMILISDGQIQEGTEWLEKALRLAPDSEQIKTHLQQARQL